MSTAREDHKDGTQGDNVFFARFCGVRLRGGDVRLRRRMRPRQRHATGGARSDLYDGRRGQIHVRGLRRRARGNAGRARPRPRRRRGDAGGDLYDGRPRDLRLPPRGLRLYDRGHDSAARPRHGRGRGDAGRHLYDGGRADAQLHALRRHRGRNDRAART